MFNFKTPFHELVKSAFPNLDPNFFKAPSLLQKERENVIIEKPYQTSTWVYACVNAIATNLSRLPRALDLTGTPEPEYKKDHPILAVLRRPNPLMTQTSFWETILLNLLLPTKKTKGGQCFLVMESGVLGTKVNLKNGEIPSEIYPFNDAFFTAIVDKNKVLTGWKFQFEGSDAIEFNLEQIIRINLTDPENPLLGQCPMWAAQSAISQDQKATDLNSRFLDNNASLGGVLETDAEIEDAEGKKILKQFDEKYSGTNKAGKTALLHSGIKYQQFQQSHVDMQYLDQRKYSRDEILAAYRVPKAEVSIYEDMNYATSQAADRSFWMKTLLPYDERILEAINSCWVQYVENGKYKLITDLSKVEALQDNFSVKLENAQKLWTMQVPVEEINRRLGLNLKTSPYPWLSTALVSFALAPAEQVLEQPPRDEGSIPPNSGAGTGTNKPTPTPETPKPADSTGGTPPVGAPSKSRSKHTEKQTKNLQFFHEQYIRKILRPDEIKFGNLMTKYMIGQRNRFLDKIDEWAKNPNTVGKVITKDEVPVDPDFFLLNPQEEDLRLLTMITPEYRRQIRREAGEMATELGPLITWGEKNPSVTIGLNNRLEKIKSINTVTFKQVRGAIAQVLEDSVDQNWTTDETAAALKEALKEEIPPVGRIKVIARTETNAIHSFTRFDVMKTEGIHKVEWVTAQDELVRGDGNDEFSHAELNGQIVEIGQPFYNGEAIKYPLDSDASPANTINCRCIIVASRDKEDNE